MNYQTKYRENERLLDGYVGFLDECITYDQKLKLSTEIGRLNEQNRLIEKMEFAATKDQLNEFALKIPAEI